MSVDSAKWTDTQLADMVRIFRTGDQTQELEIRLSLTRNAFESLYSALMDAVSAGDVFEPQLSRTINFISHSQVNESTNMIRTINYESMPPKSTYMTKTQLVKSITVRGGFMPYTVGLSSEIETSPSPVAHAAIVRLKARLSFQMVGKPWRYDITATRTGKFNEISAIIKDIREQFLPRNMTPANYLSVIDHGNVDKYEVEIEYIGENADLQPADLNVVNDLFAMITPKFGEDIAYQDKIYTIATWILGKEAAEIYRRPTYRLKRLMNAAVSMSKIEYMEVWPPIGWFLTDKADGQRAVCLCEGKMLYVILSDSMRVYESATEGTSSTTVASTTVASTTVASTTVASTTICDCELIEDGKSFNLHVFDAIVINNVNISADGFEKRVLRIEEAAKIVDEMLPVGHTATPKKYMRLGDNPAEYEPVFRGVYEAKYPYELDGIILVKPGDNYNDTLNYKWKPMSQNTIDFVAIKCPSTMLGMKPYVVRPGKTLYLLCVGLSSRARDVLGVPVLIALKSAIDCTNNRGYCPVQFSPSANTLAYLWWADSAADYDRKIVELVQDPESTDPFDRWKFVRVRTDRFMEEDYYGNDYKTAESVYMNYVDPFDFEMLWTPPSSYFTRDSTDIYRAANRFKRTVITDVFKQYLVSGSKIIDLAGGRGADLPRYESIGIAHVLFMDIDASALAELIRRKFSLLTRRGGDDTHTVRVPYDFNKRFTKSSRTTIHTLVADLTTPAEDLVVSTYQYGYNEKTVSAFVCNFAIHYMCGSEAHIANLFKFIAAMSAPGATFIFTTMNGEAVFELLKGVKTGEEWSSAEPLPDGNSDTVQRGPRKYAIRKLYGETKLMKFGQSIEVYLSFADKFVAEPLCNVSAVIAVARKHGFALELSEPMSTWFKSANRDDLSAVDQEYIGLHQIVVLKYLKK